MNRKIRICSQIISVFLATAVIFAFLFFTVVHPPTVAAQNLRDISESLNSPALFTPAPFSFPALQVSSVATIYLPIIYKSDLIYSDDFSDDESGWPEGADDHCDSRYDGVRYRLDVDNDEECFRPSPKAGELRGGPSSSDDGQGSVEVLVYESQRSTDSALGLYLNGRGGDNQYIFRIWPNNGCGSGNGGDWDFIRNRKGGRETLKHGDCNKVINRGHDVNNLLKVTHKNHQFTLYINGTQISTFSEDTSKELVGGDYVGTGVYVRASTNDDAIVKYIYFKVYRP